MNLIQDNSSSFPQGRFSILKSEQQGRCITIEFLDEDHTLGNALRHMILKNPDVKFCGYALPHPNERKINFQIQVYKGQALDALEKGLTDLLDLNRLVRERIQEAGENFGPVDLENSEDEDEQRLEAMLSVKQK